MICGLSAPSKYNRLLEDEDVKSWFDKLEARAMITATVYLRTLGLYCDLNNMSPRGHPSGGEEFRDSFGDFVRGLGKKGRLQYCEVQEGASLMAQLP